MLRDYFSLNNKGKRSAKIVTKSKTSYVTLTEDWYIRIPDMKFSNVILLQLPEEKEKYFFHVNNKFEENRGMTR